jgi:TIR domain-containing protein
MEEDRMSAFSGLQNPKLFLSHAWTNKPLARRVARRLGHRGFAVWLDEQQIQPGEPLAERVRQAIQSSSRLLVLLTKASVSVSRWVPREVAFAREQTPPIPIVPLIAESDVQSPLLDEALGVNLSDTALVEAALDDLARALRGDAVQGWRDTALMCKDLEQLGRELPLLSAIQLGGYQSHASFDAIRIDASTMHEVETFVAIEWDLATAPNGGSQAEGSTADSDIPPSDQIAYATADLFRRHGLGYYVLTGFVNTCVDRINVHNMFSRLTDGPQQIDGSIEKVRLVFVRAKQPQHVALRWFVIREFERMSEAQRAWAAAHFVQNAHSPENDALFTAFALFKLMPADKALENLWSRWVWQGRIGFDGKPHLNQARIFFRLMNDAVAQGLGQFQPCIKLFRNHVRNLARGRELRERLAAAEILMSAVDEHYVHLPDLCEEVGAAPSRAEWKQLDLPAAVTSTFVGLVAAVERGDDARLAYERLLEALPAGRPP